MSAERDRVHTGVARCGWGFTGGVGDGSETGGRVRRIGAGAGRAFAAGAAVRRCRRKDHAGGDLADAKRLREMELAVLE